MSKIVLIDITSLMAQNILTGIQRVTIELSIRFLKSDYNSILVVYNNSNNRFDIIDKKSFLDFAYDCDRMHKIQKTERIIRINDINHKYILLDIDSVWDSNCLSRSVLYKVIKKNGTKICTLVHDILPFANPEFWDGYDRNFLLYFAAVIKFADMVLCTTEAVKNELSVYLNWLNVKKEFSIIPLGSDFKKDANLTKVSSNIKKLVNNKYLLIVATIEPRKNHQLLLDAYMNLHKKYNINLIIAGRIGWMCKGFIKNVKKSGLYNKKIFIINDANNDEIIHLYKNAYAFVFPSFAEGYGLPLVESLFYGCPTFASDINVFKEVSKNHAVLFNNKNINDIVNKLEIYLKDKKKYNGLKLRVQKFKISTWDDTFNEIILKLKNVK